MSEPGQTNRVGFGMTLLACVLGLALLWYLFDGYVDRRNHPNRNLEVRAGAGSPELVLYPDPSGHYVLPGSINGHPVTFLLDTGATLVSVPAELGPELGLVPGARQQVYTANGTVTARTTRIDILDIGPFRLRDVRAHLNPGMTDGELLLGMSALRHLEFTRRDGVLILRAPSGPPPVSNP
jgi:aspartyl protease family protein